MSEDSSEFREDLKALIRSHDVGPNDLRAAADDMHDVANQWETMEEQL